MCNPKIWLSYLLFLKKLAVETRREASTLNETALEDRHFTAAKKVSHEQILFNAVS
jgi:hypothetical protein